MSRSCHYFVSLNSEKLEENNKELLKFKSRSVKAKEELQQQLEEKVKEELKTTKEGKVNGQKHHSLNFFFQILVLTYCSS